MFVYVSHCISNCFHFCVNFHVHLCMLMTCVLFLPHSKPDSVLLGIAPEVPWDAPLQDAFTGCVSSDPQSSSVFFRFHLFITYNEVSCVFVYSEM